MIPKTKHLKNISVAILFWLSFLFFFFRSMYSALPVFANHPTSLAVLHSDKDSPKSHMLWLSLLKKYFFFYQIGLCCSGTDVHAVGFGREDQVYFISFLSTERAARVRSLIHLSTQKHLVPFEVLKSTPPSLQQQALKVRISPQLCIISSGPLGMSQMHKLNYL